MPCHQQCFSVLRGAVLPSRYTTSSTRDPEQTLEHTAASCVRSQKFIRASSTQVEAAQKQPRAWAGGHALPLAGSAHWSQGQMTVVDMLAASTEWQMPAMDQLALQQPAPVAPAAPTHRKFQVRSGMSHGARSAFPFSPPGPCKPPARLSSIHELRVIAAVSLRCTPASALALCRPAT